MRLNDKLNTVEGLGEASKELRNLGKELGCPVLLLAQLSRQNENRETNNKPNKRPQLSDLRASGEIEQTADIVMFLYRDSYYNLAGMGPEDDSMEIIVQNHRNGRTGIATLRWLPRFVKFKDF
jgi:replicative DNA helicase